MDLSKQTISDNTAAAPADNEQPPVGPKTAVVSIIGRPSAGKSTFLNTASGEKISIVSEYPQTTRNAIKGIVNTSLGQLVFVDTPGLHQSDKKFNLKLTKIAQDQIADSDIILYIIDSTRDYGEEEELIEKMAEPFTDKLVIAINKTEDNRAKPEQAHDAVYLRIQIFVYSAEQCLHLSRHDRNILQYLCRWCCAAATENGIDLFNEFIHIVHASDSHTLQMHHCQFPARSPEATPFALHRKQTHFLLLQAR